jgi:hypothetical protein
MSDTTRPSVQLHHAVELALCDRPPGERVLEHLVLGAGRPERATQGGDLLDGQPPVLGEHRRVGFRQLGADLLDNGDLLGSGHTNFFLTETDWDVTADTRDVP